jgi:DNA-binding transcriptional LysR family regulator
MLGMVEAAHVAVAGATTGARARIAIATNESLSTYVLLSPLDALRRSWPNTTFEVTVMMCNEVRSGIDAGIYDMGLLLQPLDDATSSLVADRIVVSDDVPLVIFTQPSHPLAVGARSGARPGPILRDALADFPLYLSDAAGDFHSLVRRFLEDDGLPGPRLHATGSVEGVKRGVLADARALGMLPAYALVEEIEAGQVVPLRVHPAPPHMLLEALVSKTRAQHPAARRLLDELLATYQLRPDCAPSSPPRSNERRIHQTGD